MINKKQKKFEHTILAYGKTLCIPITPEEGKLFGLTNRRQVINIKTKIRKNVILIERIK